MDGLFLDRSSGRAGLKTILKAIELINNGASCVIYPEGTRSKTEELLPFKAGSFKLATKPNVPIVPTAVLGTADVFENNGLNLKAKTIYFKIGEPIIYDELDKEDQKHISKYVQNIVQEMYEELLEKKSSK